MMNAIFFLIGGLVPTLLYSRFILFIGNKISGKKFYISANSVSLILSAALYGWGGIENYPNYPIAFITGITLYAVPQFVWLSVDFFRFRKNMAAGENDKKEEEKSSAAPKK